MLIGKSEIEKIKQLFLYPILIKKYRYDFTANIATVFILLPIIVYILIVFSSTFLLVSNDYFIEQILLKAEEKAMESQEGDVLEIIDMTRAVLTNPGYRLLISAKTTFVTLRNLVLFLFACYLLTSFITEKWTFIKPFLLVTASSINILSIGFIINTILKISLLNESAVVGATLFLGASTSEGIFHFFVNKLDIFTIWFLVSLSFGVSYLYNEKKYFVILLFTMIWLLLITISFYAKFQFSFLQ